MSHYFVKLDRSILDSSIWSAPAHVRLLWIALLAMADEDGFVAASFGGLVRRAQLSEDECRDGLAWLMAPDPEDRSGVDGGRRVKVVHRGWLVVNYRAHLERRSTQELTAAELAAERQRRKRQRDRERTVGDPTTCHVTSRDSHAVTPVTPVTPRTRERSRGDQDLAKAEECVSASAIGSRARDVIDRPPPSATVTASQAETHTHPSGPIGETSRAAPAPLEPASPERTRILDVVRRLPVKVRTKIRDQHELAEAIEGAWLGRGGPPLDSTLDAVREAGAKLAGAEAAQGGLTAEYVGRTILGFVLRAEGHRRSAPMVQGGEAPEVAAARLERSAETARAIRAELAARGRR